MNNAIPTRIKPLAAFIALAAATLAGAQSPDEAVTLRRIEVTATATKTERDLFATPESISVVDFGEMENHHARSLGDILQDLPGVDIGGGPRALAQQPTIRGLSGSRVLITVDGARQNFSSGHKGRVFVDPELLKQVDVLRGPGSAVWGSGALGGVIAMTTKDAADFLVSGENWGVRTRFSGQSGDDEALATGTVFAAPGAATDLLLSGTRSRSQDIRLGGGDTLADSGSDIYAGLAKFGWQPAAGQRLQLSRQYQFESGEVPAQLDAETSPTAVLTDRETEVALHQLNYRWTSPTRPWLDLYANVYDSAQTVREKRIGSGGRLDDIDFDTTGFELRNSGAWAHGAVAHRLTYGIEYYRDRQNAGQGGAENALFPDATATFGALFVQDEIDFGKQPWSLIPGLRYDDYQSESDDSTTSGVARETEEQQLSPRLGAVYRLNPDTNLTAAYSRAFRAPNFQELYISGAHFGANEFVPNPDLKPERGESLEVGVRHRKEHAGDRFEASASLYYNSYRDFIETKVTPAATTMDNTGRARIYGGEAELTYHFGALALDTGLTLGVTRGDDLEENDPLSTIAGDKLGLQVQRCLWRCQFSLGWRGSFNRRQDRVAEGQPETPGYTVHDLFTSWRPTVAALDELQVQFGITNLTDKYYRRHLSTLPEPGRSYNLSLSLQF